ncbi:MAG TPA: Rieske 2Fe-2S domain-containing protein [Rhizomicrobium sp.]
MTKSANVEMPDNNPTKRHGSPMPAEGEGGVFSQGWYPICMSSEVETGKIRGENFLDGRVVVYRGEDGVARVMSAFCPHVGADLSVGRVIGNRIQCAFHKWEFDKAGTCVKTGIGDPPPAWAQLYKFPVTERWGVIWAHNGETPLWPLPDFQHPDEDLEYRVFRYPALACDPWVVAANTPDMQHVKVVHGAQFKSEDPHNLVTWDEWGFRYPILAEHQGGVPIEWEVSIRGTTLFQQQGPYGDFWLGVISGFGMPRPGRCEAFVIQLLRKETGPDAERLQQERFDICVQLMRRTIDDEDAAILNSIHYYPGALTKGDTTLGRYLNFVRNYPRAHPSGPFIR